MSVENYPVVPERLVQIEGRDYVRCPLHGLIPLDHECAKTPGDHWCRTAAHPAYDPCTGIDGLDDQATPHDEWDRIQGMKIANWRRIASQAVEALRLADLYLDGFVWVTEPEFSELRSIKAASKRAQRQVATLIESNGLTKKQADGLRAHNDQPSEAENRTPIDSCGDPE